MTALLTAISQQPSSLSRLDLCAYFSFGEKTLLVVFTPAALINSIIIQISVYTFFPQKRYSHRRSASLLGWEFLLHGRSLSEQSSAFVFVRCLLNQTKFLRARTVLSSSIAFLGCWQCLALKTCSVCEAWTGERVPRAFTGKILQTHGHSLYLQTNTLKELYLNVCKIILLNLLFLSYFKTWERKEQCSIP